MLTIHGFSIKDLLLDWLWIYIEILKLFKAALKLTLPTAKQTLWVFPLSVFRPKCQGE